MPNPLDERPQNPFHSVFATQTRHIAETGWALTGVVPTDPTDGPPFTYTVGLTTHDQPELVIAGLDHIVAGTLLNTMADRIVNAGRRHSHGDTVTDLLLGYPAILIDGDNTDILHPGTAIARYGTVRLRQIVWPDPVGHFPWHHDYRYPAAVQPLIGKP
jgi:hypothetical protein